MSPVEQAPPLVLYKYYPCARIDIFQNESVRFARPREFNDSFDSHYRSSQGKPTVSRRELKFRKEVGIFCLTRDPDNQLMWVHYAEQQKGFVIGFHTQSALFKNDGRQLGKVRYNPTPPDFAEMTPEQACFYKAQQWEYEEEWRCIQMFRADQSRDVSLEEGDIAEVIIGSQMSDGHLVEILEGLGTRVLEGVENIVRL